MIDLISVSHRYSERNVLRDVSLRLSQRRIAIIGANGSGKSTLARLLNGLLVPTEGQVVVDGLDTRTQGRAVRRRVGFVFQNPDTQIVMPTVAEDLAFGLRPLKLAPSERNRRVDTALSRWDLDRYRDHPAHLLSAGEKQLLAIAGVLITEPDYVVFDEPTTMLDLRNKRRIARLIHGLPQVAIVVSHDLDLLAEFERVIVLDYGHVAADDQPAAAIAAYLRLME